VLDQVVVVLLLEVDTVVAVVLVLTKIISL
jgi:hypothetical protein